MLDVKEEKSNLRLPMQDTSAELTPYECLCGRSANALLKIVVSEQHQYYETQSIQKYLIMVTAFSHFTHFDNWNNA